MLVAEGGVGDHGDRVLCSFVLVRCAHCSKCCIARQKKSKGGRRVSIGHMSSVEESDWPIILDRPTGDVSCRGMRHGYSTAQHAN